MSGLLALGLILGWISARWTDANLDPDAIRSSSEMEAAVRSAMTEVNAFDRSRSLVQLFASLDADNVSGAARAMWTRSEYLDPVDLQVFLSAWTRFDPAAAMREAQEWPSEAGREIGMRIVMREWAASGRVIEAGSYYQSLVDPELRSIVAGPLIRGWALSGDIAGALKRARIFWDQGEPVSAVDGFVRGALNSVGARRLIDELMLLEPNRAGEFERRLMRISLNLGAREDPLAAADAYARLEGDRSPEWLFGALHDVASPWADTQPAAAIEWLLERAESRERIAVLKDIMRNWAVRDLDAAWIWWSAAAEHADANETRRSAVLRSVLLPPILRGMARVRPEQASRWVEQIERSKPREALILRVAYFWAYRNRLEAEEWVESLGLSGSFSERVTAAIARGAEARDSMIREEGARQE